jgi:hypothetical protein
MGAVMVDLTTTVIEVGDELPGAGCEGGWEGGWEEEK